MPTSRLVSERYGIIAWWENAGGDAVRLDVPIAILVRRYTEPTGRGAASNIGQPIPTLGVRATTTTLSKGRLADRFAAFDTDLPTKPRFNLVQKVRAAQRRHELGDPEGSVATDHGASVRTWARGAIVPCGNP